MWISCCLRAFPRSSGFRGSNYWGPRKSTGSQGLAHYCYQKGYSTVLDIANSYRKFITDFSQISAFFNALTSSKVLFSWSTQADTAFCQLKRRVTTAHVLFLQDWASQFIIEVDASDFGVGAVLAQCSSNNGKLLPCAFLSLKLSSAEQNYGPQNSQIQERFWRDDVTEDVATCPVYNQSRNQLTPIVGLLWLHVL